MQIEVTQNLIDWYESVKHVELTFYPERIFQIAIGRALEKEKPKLPEKLPEKLCYKLCSPDENMFNSVDAINQIIDYLKAKENEKIIEH